jgi:transposase
MVTTEQADSSGPLMSHAEQRRLAEENAALRRCVAEMEGQVVAFAQREALVGQLQAELSHRDGLVALLEARTAERDELVARLEGELAELRRRLDQDSSNSSRPPSSDGPYRRPAPKVSGMPDPDEPKRRRGKQRGAKGRNRRQVADPDEVVPVDVGECDGCGAGLGDAPVLRVSRRQVFEASPPPPPRVVQFDVAERLCPCCGKVNQGKAPAGVTGRVQWGAGVAARGVLATIAHHLPYGRAAKLLDQLAGLHVSTGFLVKARERAADRLEPFMVRVRQLLHDAGLLHVDETTARTGGGLAYLHVACNDSYTAMHTGGRHKEDIDDGGVLVGFAGVLVRDGYAGYQHLVDATHAWCGAHTLRDLKGLHDGDPAGQTGADAMATTLVMALKETKAVRDAGAAALSEERLSFLRSCYAGAVKQIREDNQANSTPLHERGLTLARRFEANRDMILRFMTDLSVPFTNNAAEREVRPVKVKQRSGGCWRTLDGLADFAVIWSYLSTAAKHGIDALDALTQLFATGPWMPPDPAPT